MTNAMERALKLHDANSAAFLATVGSVPDVRWDQPWTEGKWSPAEIAAHLVAIYAVVNDELRGGPGMRIVLPWWGQILAKLFVAWRILYFGAFPKAAKAPRETRPSAGLPKEEALARFRSAAAEFDTAARLAAPDAFVTHAYFGRGPVARGVVIVARHIEHHRSQLEGLKGLP
ncbi:MAG: DinB family protein [Thermoanaerobaculia bacterium]